MVQLSFPFFLVVRKHNSMSRPSSRQKEEQLRELHFAAELTPLSGISHGLRGINVKDSMVGLCFGGTLNYAETNKSYLGLPRNGTAYGRSMANPTVDHVHAMGVYGAAILGL